MKKKASVLINGGGPVGLVLANLLGKLGIKTIIVERETAVFPVPRATHLDEETLRNFQLTGLMDELEKYTAPFGSAHILDENGVLLLKEKIIQADSVHEYIGSRFFDQPAFETILWEGLKRFINVEIFKGYTAIELSQSSDNVSLTIQNIATKEEIQLVGEWLVACDGGKSFVRDFLDIKMDSLESPREWIIVDSLLKAEEDACFLPSNLSYIFDNERLHLFASGMGKHNRWEFQLNKGEEMPDEAVITSWVAHYVPLEKIQITRIAKYTHNVLVAQTWQRERIFLAGDAAHLMPPFAGQGLCSGVRDAVNLAWKLAEVVQGGNRCLLATYRTEREPHLFQIFKRTLFLSGRLYADDALQRLWRKVQIQAISFFPAIKDYLNATHNIPQKLLNGFLYKPSELTGQHLPQFCLENQQLTDDFIGYQFAMVAKPNIFTQAEIKALQEKNIYILTEKETKPFENWLTAKQVDFVLVRPDKIIFGAGKKTDFESIWLELSAYLHTPILSQMVSA